MKKLVLAAPILGARARRIHRLRDQEDGQAERRRSERQGRHAVEVGRGEPGAHPRQRRADRRSRSEGAGGGPAAPRRPDSAPTRRTRAADKVNARADAIETASKRLVYEVVLSEDQGNFKFGKATMPDEAQGRDRPAGRAAEGEPERRLHRDRRPHRQRRRQGHQRQARPRARRSGEAVSLRAAPDSAAQDQRDQLRRREADRAEQDQGRPRAEPPRRHQGPGVRSAGRGFAARRRGSADSGRGRTGGGSQEVGAGMVRRRVHRLNVSTFAGCFAFRPRSDAAGLVSPRLCRRPAACQPAAAPLGSVRPSRPVASGLIRRTYASRVRPGARRSRRRPSSACGCRPDDPSSSSPTPS